MNNDNIYIGLNYVKTIHIIYLFLIFLLWLNYSVKNSIISLQQKSAVNVSKLKIFSEFILMKKCKLKIYIAKKHINYKLTISI